MRKPPKLTLEQALRLNEFLISDRQWRREHRIGYARLMLKYAYATEPEAIPFWQSVLIYNDAERSPVRHGWMGKDIR